MNADERRLRIYVASSWRNQRQPDVVAALRAAGHQAYDFRNPRPDDLGFHWSEIDPDWRSWPPASFVRGLGHTKAISGFYSDIRALEGCDLCVLVNPSGRSAHLEAGIAAGLGKWLCILLADGDVPELMYLAAHHFAISIADVLRFARGLADCGAPWPAPLSPGDPLRLALMHRDLTGQAPGVPLVFPDEMGRLMIRATPAGTEEQQEATADERG